MKLINISLYSLKRQKSKKIFLLSAMILSLATILTLFTLIENQQKKIENEFDEFGANIVITPKTESLSLSYGGINLGGIVTSIEEIKETDVEKIYSIENNENISAVSPKLIGVGQVQAGDLKSEVLLVGVIPEEERKIKSWWDIEGEFPIEDNEILAGRDVAEKLNLSTGSEVSIQDKVFTVTGILRLTGSQDDSALIAPISAVEEILGKHGKVSLIEVSALCSDCPIDELVSQIAFLLPEVNVRAVRQVMEQKMLIVGKISRFTWAISLILIILCGLIVLSTVSGSISERKKEIGIFRALGYSRSNIIRIILSESLIISFSAGIIGCIAAISASYTFLPILADIEVTELFFNKSSFLVGVLGVIFLGTGASWWPAVYASNIDPVKTINSF
jgi:putative ABC transport system permease protein